MEVTWRMESVCEDEEKRMKEEAEGEEKQRLLGQAVTTSA